MATPTSTPCSRPAPEQCPTARSAPAARASAPAAGSSVLLPTALSRSSSCGMHSPAAAWRSSPAETVVVASGRRP